jgi:hypothetical protein
VEACCSCTSNSTCKTNQCEFRAHYRHCRSCRCHQKCSNKNSTGKKTATNQISVNKAIGLDILSTNIHGDKVNAIVTSIEIESLFADTQQERGEEEVAGKGVGAIIRKLRRGQEDEPSGDLPGATLSDADRMMDTVYGDHVHQKLWYTR